MNKIFDIELFLTAVLSGAHASKLRHLRQAKAIQTAIIQRWDLDNPWQWQRKHLVWFKNQHLKHHAGSTRYYFSLTIALIEKRMGKNWQLIGQKRDGA